MAINGQTEASKLRARFGHPVIDADGHWIEYGPVMREEFRRIGGDAAAEALDLAASRVPNALKMSANSEPPAPAPITTIDVGA